MTPFTRLSRCSSESRRGDPAFKPGRKRRFTSPKMSAAFDSVFAYPGYRLLPTPAQEAVPRDHCSHARHVAPRSPAV